MVVVISIVIILVTIGLPAAQDMWQQQRRSDAVNLIEGMLKTTRAAAIQGGEGETGLFFFVDDRGVQRAAAIRRADPNSLDARLDEYGYDLPFDKPVLGQNKTRYLLALENVFQVVQDRVYKIPPPYRVTPRYVVDPQASGGNSWDFFSETELANNTFEELGSNVDNNQRHRNYFTLVFGPGGELLPGRDVLILDFDTLVENEARGDVTGLDVGYDRSKGATVTTWLVQNASSEAVPLEPETRTAIPFLVYDAENPDQAINFPSVDGLLLYDDSLFNEFTDPANKRAFLLRTAQPLYINRLNGGVVRGPVNENPDLNP
jgi:type II secretory pathway pseudopilin PulG